MFLKNILKHFVIFLFNTPFIFNTSHISRKYFKLFFHVCHCFIYLFYRSLLFDACRRSSGFQNFKYHRLIFCSFLCCGFMTICKLGTLKILIYHASNTSCVQNVILSLDLILKMCYYHFCFLRLKF